MSCLACALQRLRRYTDPTQPYDPAVIRVAADDARELANALFRFGQFWLATAALALSAVLDSRAANHEQPSDVKGPPN